MKDEIEAFKNVLYDGLKAHSGGRVESLTISLAKGSNADLYQCFKTLIKRIVSKRKQSSVHYAGVLVGNPPQHAHIFWVKPYVRWDELTGQWADITQDDSHIRSKSIVGDKSKRSEMRTLVNYVIRQQEHHNQPVMFIRSSRWSTSCKDRVSVVQSLLGVEND